MNLLNNHRHALITGIVIAVVLALLIGGTQFNPVSYTHLTLPTTERV